MVLLRVARAGEPVRTLPAELLPEHRAKRPHPFVARRSAVRTRGRAFFVRVVDGEDVGVGFLVLRLQVGAGGVVAETARVDAEHVDGRLAFDDPLGQLPPGAPRRGDAETVPLVQPEVRQAPGRADDRAAVRRVRDGAIEDLLHAEFGERRHAANGGLDVRREAIQIRVEQLVLALRVRPVQIAGRRAFLVRAEQQAARFLAHVPRSVGFPQHAHFRQAGAMAGLNVRMRFGDDVLVLNRQHRNVEADERSGAAGEVAGGADHVFAHHAAVVRGHAPFAA